LTIEPENKDLLAKLYWAQQQRARKLATVPSTVAEELTYNPFMRCNQASVAKKVGKEYNDPVSVLAEIRRLKDNWKGVAKKDE
jgi:hydroxyacylglutathione hydrolase